MAIKHQWIENLQITCKSAKAKRISIKLDSHSIHLQSDVMPQNCIFSSSSSVHMQNIHYLFHNPKLQSTKNGPEPLLYFELFLKFSASSLTLAIFHSLSLSPSFSLPLLLISLSLFWISTGIFALHRVDDGTRKKWLHTKNGESEFNHNTI